MLIGFLLLLFSAFLCLVGTKEKEAEILYYTCDAKEMSSGVESDAIPMHVTVTQTAKPDVVEETPQPVEKEETYKPTAEKNLESIMREADPVDFAQSTYDLLLKNGGKTKL